MSLQDFSVNRFQSSCKKGCLALTPLMISSVIRGRRPRITDEVIRGVNARHPFLQLDWKRLSEKSLSDLAQPLRNNAQYLRDMVAAVRNLHIDLADMPLPVLDFAKEPELSSEFIAGLKLLRGTLDVKLNQLRRVKGVPYRT